VAADLAALEVLLAAGSVEVDLVVALAAADSAAVKQCKLVI
jgi:hypothetical protein